MFDVSKSVCILAAFSWTFVNVSGVFPALGAIKSSTCSSGDRLNCILFLNASDALLTADVKSLFEDIIPSFIPTRWAVSLAILIASDSPLSPVNANVKFLIILSTLFCISRSSNSLANPRPKSAHASDALLAPEPISLNI